MNEKKGIREYVFVKKKSNLFILVGTLKKKTKYSGVYEFLYKIY